MPLKIVINGVSTGGAWISSLCTAGIAALISTDVALRALGGRGIEGVVEIATILLVVVAHFGLAAAQSSGYHVATGVLVDRLPVKTGAVVSGVSLLACAGYLAILTYATLQRAITATRTMESSYGVVDIPIWPARWAIAIGLAWLTIEVMRSAWNTFVEKSIQEEAGHGL